MKLLIHMHLLSDTIFGSGMSMPGGEDICILTDEQGFPYMKGSTLKGIFRSELINYLDWSGSDSYDIMQIVSKILGEGGSNQLDRKDKLVFSDLTLDDRVMEVVSRENAAKQEILDMFSYVRDFTALENGLAKKKSLRSVRCIKSNLNFYAVCFCDKADADLVERVLRQIKWVGSMRNRGFGKVSLDVEEIYE